MHRVLERQLRKLGIGEGPPTSKQWREFMERVNCAYTEADQDRYTLERAIDLSSAEMRKRFNELRSAQGQLIEASRKAGRADVATNVLHNVGNVLNSVNVSANVVANLAKNSPRSGLGKSLQLLHAQPQPGRFLDEDPRGKKLLLYLDAIDKSLSEERENMLRELDGLARHIEHIKTIVGQQLATAKGVRVTEQVSIPELIEDAIKIVRSSHNVSNETFVRDCAPCIVGVDRHKVFQIVINLLTNASDAVAERGHDARIFVRSRRIAEGRVVIEVEDNGVGIPADTITLIFNHGFTTKPQGHGFGLHSCACAAMELGGSLSAHSEGSGHGARFTLLLPDDQRLNKPA